MRTIIVGLCGKKHNGKSVFCDELTDKYNISHSDDPSGNTPNRVARVNFKDPLLQLAYLIGWNGEKDEKGRRFLQLLGTDCIRECIDMDYWAKKWIQMVNNCKNLDSVDLIIADDVRFENEAEAVKSFGGLIVNIDTPSQNTGPKDDHISESGIDSNYYDETYSLEFGLNHIKTAVEIFYQTWILGNKPQNLTARKQILGS